MSTMTAALDRRDRYVPYAPPHPKGSIESSPLAPNDRGSNPSPKTSPVEEGGSYCFVAAMSTTQATKLTPSRFVVRISPESGIVECGREETGPRREARRGTSK